MERRGISQAELARQIGAAPASVTLLFKTETVQSGFVPAIHRALGLQEPVSTLISERDDARRRLDRIWRELGEAERELLLDIATRFRRPRD